MNDLFLFSSIVFTIIRVIGVGITYEFYLDARERVQKFFVLSWTFFAIGGIFPVIAQLTTDGLISDFMFLLSITFTSLAALLLIYTLHSYFSEIATKFFLLLVIIICCLPFSLYAIFGYKLAIQISVVTDYFIFLTFFMLPYLLKGKIQKFLDKRFIWYYITSGFFLALIVISIYNFTQGYSWGLYDADNVTLMIIQYSIGVCLTLSLLILIIFIDYAISLAGKSEMKDKYSHDLGNILQVILNANTLLSEKRDMQDVERENLETLIQSKLQEAAKLIREIRQIK
jgi:signal transduction histidine kinase